MNSMTCRRPNIACKLEDVLIAKSVKYILFITFSEVLMHDGVVFLIKICLKFVDICYRNYKVL